MNSRNNTSFKVPTQQTSYVTFELLVSQYCSPQRPNRLLWRAILKLFQKELITDKCIAYMDNVYDTTEEHIYGKM